MERFACKKCSKLAINTGGSFVTFNQIVNRTQRQNIREGTNKKYALERKQLKKNKLFYLKVCNVLRTILYCIRKYFIMWDVQPHSIISRSRNDPEYRCL